MGLKDAYQFQDFAPFQFPGGYQITLGREGLKPYQDHLSDFFKKFELTGGRRRAKPSEKQVEEAQKEGIKQHLFREMTGPDINGDGSAGRQMFEEMLANEEFFLDVLLCIRDRESFVQAKKEETASS